MGNSSTQISKLEKQLEDITNRHNKLKDLLDVSVLRSFVKCECGDYVDVEILYKYTLWISENYDI